MRADYDWERAYIDAVLETDDSKLSNRIENARKAMNLRFRELVQIGGNAEQRQAITEAFQLLKTLREERIKSPQAADVNNE
jgi:hypothetical protein